MPIDAADDQRIGAGAHAAQVGRGSAVDLRVGVGLPFGLPDMFPVDHDAADTGCHRPMDERGVCRKEQP